MKILLKEYPEFNLYQIDKQIFAIEADDSIDLSLHFLKFQESIDNPLFKGKNVDHLEFIEWYMKNYGRNRCFSYHLDYIGFNLTEEIFEFIYNLDFIFNKYDKRMFEVWTLIKDRIGNKPFSLMGYKTGSEDCLLHEYGHALFHLNKKYQNEMLILIEEFKTNYKKEYNKIIKQLKKWLYDESVYDDELQAYIGCDTTFDNIVSKDIKRKFENVFKKYKKI